jgi:hypothetical protein
MVASTRTDLVCLQETKKATISRGMVLSMLGAEFDVFIVLTWWNIVGLERKCVSASKFQN